MLADLSLYYSQGAEAPQNPSAEPQLNQAEPELNQAEPELNQTEPELNRAEVQPPLSSQLTAPCTRAAAAAYYGVSARAIGNWVDALLEKRQPILDANDLLNEVGIKHLEAINRERCAGGSFRTYCDRLEPPAPSDQASAALATIETELIPDFDAQIAKFMAIEARADSDICALVEKVVSSREQSEQVTNLLVQAARTRGKQIGVRLATEEYVAMEDARRKVLQKMAEINLDD